MAACSHDSCTCQISGCGIDHPPDWTPKMTASINGVVVAGDDAADCVAHYLIQCGYPTDRPEHLRKVSQLQADRMAARSDHTTRSTDG